MTNDRDEPPSFDPATWLGSSPRPAANPAPPASTAGSFDPRSWAQQPAIAQAGAPAAPGAAAARDPESRRKLLASGAAAAILLAGFVTAYASRPAQAPVAAPSAVAAKAAPEGPLPTRNTLVLASSAELPAALAANGIAAAEAQQIAARAGPLLAPDSEVRAVLTLVETDGAKRFVRLDASLPDGSGAVVTRGADGFAASRVAAQLHSAVHVVRGEMNSDSFYSAAVAAGVPDSLVPDFAQAFSFDFDFQREIKPGDVFEAAFEQSLNPAGQPVGQPRLIYASLQTSEKSRALYRFAPRGGEAGWYDGNGRSIVRSLMRTPVDGAHVTSSFGMRVHPVLGFTKMHNGIDFGAPIGTPIYASGSGTIELASPSATAGNWLKLRHDNGWETVYMHMNRYMPGIVAGKHIAQGTQIGEIGTTGRSTGPHLHYELHVDGAAVDPSSVQTEEGHALAGGALDAFRTERDRIDVSRAAQAS